MTCPDCGGELKGVPLGNAGDTSESFRCYTCGGFLLSTWLANRINSRMLINFDMHTGVELIKGNNTCPRDGTPLNRFTGESAPANLQIMRCDKCAWWWFPGNNLFAFKPAQEAKVAYFKSWGMAASLSALLLPVMTLVIMVVGTAIGVNMLKYQQKTGVNASSEVYDVYVGYIGSGQALVSFKSKTKLETIDYKKIEDTSWFTWPVKLENDLYITKILNLEEQKIYLVRILGKEFELRTMLQP